MKKLLVVIIVISLPLIVFFQYQNYKRFNPPTDYEYVSASEVDVNYHDQILVEEYYSKIVEASAYARQKWSNEGVDVRFPDTNSETELNISKYYNTLIGRIKYLESKLNQSRDLKINGYNNQEIVRIENGVSPVLVSWADHRESLVDLAVGDKGDKVWVLQKQLIKKGYVHTLDGIFEGETRNAIRKFQVDNDYYPSGEMNPQVFKALFQD